MKTSRKTRESAEISIVLSPATARHPRQTEASMLAFPGGRLLVAYSDFYGGDWRDEGPGRIAGRWSMDEGRSWSRPFVLQENIGRLNCMSASLLQLPSGRILLAFGRKDAQPTLLHAMVKHSDDEGRTWSQPQDITRGDRYWCITNDRLVRLSSGRILYPLESGLESECCVWYSDDDGARWKMSRRNITAAKGTHYAEPTVVELPGGRVAMYIRTTAGNLHIAMSKDGGESWKMHKGARADMAGRPDAGPAAAYSPCMVKRVPGTRDLLLVWNNHRIRTPLTAAISRDSGDTWQHLRNIEEMDGWPPTRTHTYPSLTFFGRNVHLTYWEARRRPGGARQPNRAGTPGRPADRYFVSLKYRRLPLAWFYEKA
jgi:hypothetical protein